MKHHKAKKAHRKKSNKAAERFLLWNGEMNDIGRFNGLSRNDRTQRNIYSYPNPASDQLVIQLDLPQAQSKLSVMITNLQGQSMRQFDFAGFESGRQNLTLDLAGLSSGQYIYKIIGKNYSKSEQFIVQ